MSRRTNFTISDQNYTWLRDQAPGERGMSELIDRLVQRERTLGPIETRLQRQADQLDLIMNQTTRRNIHGI
jgi:predicted CopG family antitoxin